MYVQGSVTYKTITIISQHMDNIAMIGIEAVCCSLPFLAFILLALQFYVNLPLAKSQVGGSSDTSAEFPCAMGGLISIKSQLTCKQVQSCSVLSSKSTEDVAKSEVEAKNNYLHEIQKQTFQFGRKVLTGCNVGLAKMNYINKAYFRRNKAEDTYKSCKDQRRKKIKSSLIREWFEPTCLVTIVEGLQC